MAPKKESIQKNESLREAVERKIDGLSRKFQQQNMRLDQMEKLLKQMEELLRLVAANQLLGTASSMTCANVSDRKSDDVGIRKNQSAHAADSISCKYFGARFTAIQGNYRDMQSLFFCFDGGKQAAGKITHHYNFFDDAIIIVELESAAQISPGDKFSLLFTGEGEIVCVYKQMPQDAFAEAEFMKGKLSTENPLAATHFATAAQHGHKESVKELISLYEQMGRNDLVDYWKNYRKA